jgi:MFS transporter, DHA2 family, multidrug resistance protein
MSPESTQQRHGALLDVSEKIAAHRDLPALFHALANTLHGLVHFDYLNLVLYVPVRVIFGLSVSAAGLLQVAHFNLEIDFRTAVIARIVQSVGLAFLFIPINVSAFSSVPKEKTNYATGLVNLARNFGGSSGIALATTMLSRRSQYHQANMVGHLTPLDANYQSTLHGLAQTLIQRGSDATQALNQAQAMLYGMVQRQSMMRAFVDVFWLLAMVFLAVVPLVFLMKKVQPHKGPVMAE